MQVNSKVNIPGSYSRSASPVSSRRPSVSEAPSESLVIEMSELAPDHAPDHAAAHAADAAAPAPAPAAEPPVARPAADPAVLRTGRAAALVGALLSGGHQLLAQGVGVIGRAGVQTGLLLWAGRSLRVQVSVPAPAPVPRPEGPADGNRSDTSGSGDAGGSVEPRTGPASGDSADSPGLQNDTATGNITFFGNETGHWNGTDPWVGGDSNITARSALDRSPGIETDPGPGPESADIALMPLAPGPFGFRVPSPHVDDLAGIAAAVQASLVPPGAPLPAPDALPGAVHRGQASLAVHASPALAGPIALAGAIVAASVLLSAARVYELGRGAIAALRGRDLAPETPEGRRRGARLTGALGLVTALGPVAYALCADKAKAKGSDEAMLMVAWLLINAAGRTCQNLLRDTFTQATKGLLPSLRYQIPPGGLGPHDPHAPWEIASPGSAAFKSLQLRSRVLWPRAGLTFASYWVGAYLCMTYLTPALKQAMATGRLDLESQAQHHFGSLQLLEASLPPLVTSALIESLDSLTASLSTSGAAAAAGARIEWVRASRPASLAAVLREISDHLAMRVFNSVGTVDLERAISAMTGFDRESPAGRVLQSFVLSLTDCRGFLVQFGQHMRLAAQGQPAPAVLASDSDTEDDRQPVRLHL